VPAVLPEAAELSKIVCPPVAAVVLSYPDSAFKVIGLTLFIILRHYA
jgi:hypothetical protein